MRLIWELIRVAWAVGCLPIGALLLVVLVLTGFNLPFFLGFSNSENPAIRWLFWVLFMYFAGGGWFFWKVNEVYGKKLRRIADKYRSTQFEPQVEVFAKINDAYVGIDPLNNKLLAYPVNGDGHFFKLNEIGSWRIVPVGKRNYRLELLTTNLCIPSFGLALKPWEVVNTEARLRVLLGN